MKVLLLALLASLLVAVPASASGPQPLSFSPGFAIIQQPVEQESPNFFDNNCGGDPGNPACDPSTWVTNPTGCAWDLDDTNSEVGNNGAAATLAAGASASGSLCVVSDGFNNFGGDPKGLKVIVRAPTSTLIVTVTSDFGSSYTASVTPDGRSFNYVVCQTADLPYGRFGTYPPIAGSNGGTGVVVNYTITVRNPGSHKANVDLAVFETGPSGNYAVPGC